MMTGPAVSTGSNGGIDRRPIVVGLDGSENATRALEWALREAARVRSDLEVVHVWHRLTASGTSYGSEHAAAAYVAAEVRQAVAAVTPTVDRLPTILERTANGSAARTLIALSRNARLLVLGQSRHAAVRELLPGSVGAICVRRSPAPVAIVPEHGDVVVMGRAHSRLDAWPSRTHDQPVEV